MAVFGSPTHVSSLTNAQAQLRSATLDGNAAPKDPNTFFSEHEVRKHSFRKAKLKDPHAVVGGETSGRRAGREGGKTYLTTLVVAEALGKRVVVDASALVKAMAPGNTPARDRHFGELSHWIELTRRLSTEAGANAEHIKALIPELARDADGQAKVLAKSYQIRLALTHMQQHGYSAETAWAQARTAAVPVPDRVRMERVPRTDRKHASPARQPETPQAKPATIHPESSQQAEAEAREAARAAEVIRVAAQLCEKEKLLKKSPGLAEHLAKDVIRRTEECGRSLDAVTGEACSGFRQWKFGRQGGAFFVKGLEGDADFVKTCETWQKEQSDKDYAEGAQTVMRLFQTQGETPAFVKRATHATSLS